MKKDEIKKIYDNLDLFSNKQVVVAGWVKSVRTSKDFGFIDLTDGTCFKTAQIVFFANTLKNYEDVEKLNTGSTIICKGNLVLTPENKQPFEIKAESVE